MKMSRYQMVNLQRWANALVPVGIALLLGAVAIGSVKVLLAGLTFLFVCGLIEWTTDRVNRT
jgi:hypothetical protein